MVRFHNYHHLQSDQNVHESMEAGSIFMQKCTPVIASSAINLIAFFGLKNGKGY